MGPAMTPVLAGSVIDRRRGRGLGVTKILIVDDEPDIRAILRDILEPTGYAIETTGDGEAGLAAALDDAVSLVILDVWLPKIEGIAVLKELHQKRPGLPVIILSGGSKTVPLEHSAALAEAYGAAQVILKPFRSAEVLDSVARALGTELR